MWARDTLMPFVQGSWAGKRWSKRSKCRKVGGQEDSSYRCREKYSVQACTAYCRTQKNFHNLKDDRYFWDCKRPKYLFTVYSEYRASSVARTAAKGRTLCSENANWRSAWAKAAFRRQCHANTVPILSGRRKTSDAAPGGRTGAPSKKAKR